MDDQFGFSSLRDTWVNGFAGRYGWLDYHASSTISNAFTDVVIAIGLLCLIVAVARRDAIRRHRIEALAAISFCGFLWVIIAKPGYDYHRTTDLIFEQPRYLFPICAFWALAVAVACFGLGRRAFPYLGTLVVALLCLHDLTGLALTISRYYG